MIIFDIEVYKNLFVAVFKNLKSKEIEVFTLWESINASENINEIKDVVKYLKENQNEYFIGYNNLNYDSQILEFIIRNKFCSTSDIKTFNDEVIASQWSIFKENDLSNLHIDLMLVHNFGPMSAKKTSLKALEFMLRKKKIADLPYHFNDYIQKKSQVDEIIKYCIYDVEVTEDIYNLSTTLIKAREELGNQENLHLLNSPEPDIARQYISKYLSLSMNMSLSNFKKLKTYNNEINGKDIILPHINIKFTNEFIDIYNFYYNLKLYPTEKSKINDNKIISLKNKVNKEFKIQDTTYVYAAGGLHACIKPGVYKANDNWIIEDYDKTSFYPHFAMLHGISPGHIDSNIYSSLQLDLFNKRKQYDKKTHPLLNYMLKIILNSAYGLGNSEYSPFYDTKATLAICVNGMLTLSMLLDRLFENIPELIVYQCNTDGITIGYHKKNKEKVHKIYNWLTSVDNIPYELNEYKLMTIMDVNNYLALDITNKIKSKGRFETYNEIFNSGQYHKDTSANIIPIALQKYFIEGIPIEETIDKENNIHEFCYGVKGSTMYRWLLTNYNQDSGVSKSELFDARFVRYFAGGTQTLCKFWIKGKKINGIDAIQANIPITLLQNIPKTDILDFNKKGELINKKNNKGEYIYRYPNLNREWYKNECYKILKQIKND